jgi:hypothetical protein
MNEMNETPADDPQFQADNEALNKIIMAGQRLLYDPKTFPIFKEGISAKQPLSNILAIQTAGLIKMIDKKAGGKLPKHVVVPAAVTLLAEIAKFMNDAGLAEPTEEEVKLGLKKMLDIVGEIYSPAIQSQPGAEPGQADAPAEAAPPEGIPPSGMAAGVAPPPDMAGGLIDPQAGGM